jgi:tetratricopeptide (TPR) repeat protein
MARSTVFRYKGVEVDPQEVGSRLGVRAVLTGRVLHRGDALNIQTELVDVSDGSQVWGEQYNRKASDIFAVQEEIAKELTGKLRLRLSGEEKGRLNKRHTENMEAYQLYLKGRYFWNKRTIEGVKRGMDYFQQAIGIDPYYAAAYTGLADCYAKLGDVGTPAMPSKEAFFKGKIAATKALEIDGALAEAHTSLAHFHLHDYKWSEAELEFKRAFELNPNYATAHHWYAYCLLMVGRPDEALAEIARALELDPLSLPINNDFGDILYFARRYDRAIEQLQKTLEMDPQYLQARVDLARVYEQKGMYKEAVAEFLEAKELSADNVDVLASLAHTFAVSGEREEASKVLARLKKLSKRKYVSPYNLAVVYTGLGEKDRVFEWLHKAYEENAEWMIYLTLDPRFDPLRTDSRFTELARRVGLQKAQV